MARGGRFVALVAFGLAPARLSAVYAEQCAGLSELRLAIAAMDPEELRRLCRRNGLG